MSANEVLRAIAAVVSAFTTAAESLEVIKVRKEKKKRKKEKEIEELVEVKILYKSLIEGATQCRKCSEDRHNRYGPTFAVGDAIAASALKDVVISLQTEIIQALQIAKAIENAVLDLTVLHESSITCRKDALTAMDRLCQRTMGGDTTASYISSHSQSSGSPNAGSQYGGFQYNGSPYADKHYDKRRSVSPVAQPESQIPYRIASHDSSSSMPTLPAGVSIPHQPSEPRAATTARQGIRQSLDLRAQRLGQTISGSSATKWIGAMKLNRRDKVIRGPSLPEDEEARDVMQFNRRDEPMKEPGVPVDEEVRGRPTLELPEFDKLSLQDSAVGSPSSELQQNRQWRCSEDPRSACPTKQSSLEQPFRNDQKLRSVTPSNRSSSPKSKTKEVDLSPASGPKLRITNADLSPESEGEDVASTASSRATQSQARRAEAISSVTSASTSDRRPSISSSTDFSARKDNMSQGDDAPLVVTKEFGSMLPQNSQVPADLKQPEHLNDVHAATSMPQNPADAPPASELWLPLARPAKENNYHGFCKGAWQIRESTQEGLSVHNIANDQGRDIPHWGCKLCRFSAKVQSSTALPDQIFFNSKCGVRYRWVFLAKSHVATVGSFKRSESYSYGCIFCAAEGRTTAVHQKLDSLMLHIVSKHQTQTMTSDTREKTKCIVGGKPDRSEDWDINVPESKIITKAGAVEGSSSPVLPASQSTEM